MKRMLASIVVTLALTIASVNTDTARAAGGTPVPIERATKLTDGVYYDPQQSGSSLTLQRLGEDAFFGTLNSYDAEGHPVWYIFTATVARGESVRAALLSASGGQCLGCSHTPPVVQSSGYEIEIEPVNAFTVNVKHGSIESKMVRAFPRFNQRYPGNSSWFAVFEATVRIPGPDDTDKVFTGDVHGFAIPLSAPLDAINNPAAGTVVFGLWCNNSRCYNELVPIFSWGVPDASDFNIPVVAWKEAEQTASLETMYRDGTDNAGAVTLNPPWKKPAAGFEFELERISATEMFGEGLVRDPESGQMVNGSLTLTLVRQMP